MAGRTTCREDLSAIWCLREGWRGSEKNGEERYRFHEMKRPGFEARIIGRSRELYVTIVSASARCL
jgi:hypothetical protein